MPSIYLFKRSKMLQKLLLVFILFCLSACSGPNDYSETYIILRDGESVGKEIIHEKIDRKGNRTCLSEQEMVMFSKSKGKKESVISTKTIIPNKELFPTFYSYESNTGTSFNIKLEDGKIIKTQKNKGEVTEIITPIEPGMLMLDLSVFHTINYWFRKYNINKKEPQVFRTYFPHSASIGSVSVSPGDTVTPVHNLQVQLKNYEMEVDNELKILLWMDKENHLYWMQGPNIDVIQSDLYDRLNKKMNQENKK